MRYSLKSVSSFWVQPRKFLTPKWFYVRVGQRTVAIAVGLVCPWVPAIKGPYSIFSTDQPSKQIEGNAHAVHAALSIP